MEKLNSSVDICLGWLSTQLCTATANSERNLKKKNDFLNILFLN